MASGTQAAFAWNWTVQDRKRCRQHATRDDTVGEILDDRETERRDQDGRGPPVPQHRRELALLRHIPGNNH